MPLIVPVTLRPETIKPDPSVVVLPENVRLPPNVWLVAVKFWKIPLVKLAVVPVTVVPESCVVNTPDAKLAVVPVMVTPVRTVNAPLMPVTVVN